MGVEKRPRWSTLPLLRASPRYDAGAMGGDSAKGEGRAAVFVVLLLIPVFLLLGTVAYFVLIRSDCEPRLGGPAWTGGGSIFCDPTSNPVAWIVFLGVCAALATVWVTVVWLALDETGGGDTAGLGMNPSTSDLSWKLDAIASTDAARSAPCKNCGRSIDVEVGRCPHCAVASPFDSGA